MSDSGAAARERFEAACDYHYKDGEGCENLACIALISTVDGYKFVGLETHNFCSFDHLKMWLRDELA